MDWKKWLTYSPYKKLWSIILGRPWTYVARDIYHQFEYIILVSLFIGGYAAGQSHLVSWKWLFVLMSTYTIGFIHGHFFWGTKYTPGQPGEIEQTPHIHTGVIRR